MAIAEKDNNSKYKDLKISLVEIIKLLDQDELCLDFSASTNIICNKNKINLIYKNNLGRKI